MRKSPDPAGTLLLSLVVAALYGCASEPVPLVNISGRGEQWVYPFFLQEQPTILAFWNTGEMQCFYDVTPLVALDARPESVGIVSVVTGRNRAEIDKWIRQHGIPYVVLLDENARLAADLNVTYYPTYIFFDTRGREIQRVTEVREVRKWYYPRWVERAANPPRR